MVHRHHRSPQVIEPLGLGLDRRAGDDFVGVEAGEGGGSQHPARDPQALDHGLAVLALGQQVGIDRRGRPRVRARQGDGAAALRPHIDRDDAEAMAERDREPRGVAVRGDEDELDVRPVQIGAAADEAVRLQEVAAQRSRPEQQVFEDVPGVARQRPPRQAVGLRAGGSHRHRGGGVVAEVPADRGQVVDAIDPHRLQRFGVADARKQQEMGRAVGAGADDHLASGGQTPFRTARLHLDADRAALLDQDAEGRRLGKHGEIRPAPGRIEEGARHRHPHPAPDRRLARPEALRIGPVEIDAAAELQQLGRGQVVVDQRVVARDIDDIHLAADTVIGRVPPPLVVLGLLEVGQDLGVAPSLRAVRAGPVVEVARVAAEVDHAVDRTRSPDHPAARQGHAPAAGRRLWRGAVAPAQPGVPDRRRHRGRNTDLVGAVAAAGFHEADPHRRIGGEPVGEHAAGGPRADDDVVERVLRLRPGAHGFSPPPR